MTKGKADLNLQEKIEQQVNSIVSGKKKNNDNFDLSIWSTTDDDGYITTDEEVHTQPKQAKKRKISKKNNEKEMNDKIRMQKKR